MTMITIRMRGYHCRRCDHRWIARQQGMPKMCARCKSLYWRLSEKEYHKKFGPRKT